MFTLSPIEDVEFLSAEAESWMVNVKKRSFGRDWGNKLNFLDRRQKTLTSSIIEENKIAVGDTVKLEDDTKSSYLKTEFGGEYQVLACENHNILIKVDGKDTLMPAVFFQKVNNEKQS